MDKDIEEKTVGMRRNYRTVKVIIGLRMQNLMMFRLGFFGPFIVDGTLFGIQLFMFRAIYGHVDAVGGWDSGKMVLFIGTFSMINAVNMVVFFFGLNEIPDRIRTGDLDLYLTKPVHPLLRLTFEKMNPGSVPLLILSLAIIGYGVSLEAEPPSGKAVMSYLFWVLLMTVLWYEVELLIRLMSFFVVSSASLIQVEEVGLEMCMQIPGVVFQKGFRVLFWGILPYGIMATFPVMALTGEGFRGMTAYGIGITVVFGMIAAVVWKKGLEHYHSVSS